MPPSIVNDNVASSLYPKRGVVRQSNYCLRYGVLAPPAPNGARGKNNFNRSQVWGRECEPAPSLLSGTAFYFVGACAQCLSCHFGRNSVLSGMNLPFFVPGSFIFRILAVFQRTFPREFPREVSKRVFLESFPRETS